MSVFRSDHSGFDSREPTAFLWPSMALFIAMIGGLAGLAALGLVLLQPYSLSVDSRGKAEAEAAFRKREAELAAEAKVREGQLKALDIPTSAFSLVAERSGPAVVNISNLVGVATPTGLDLEFQKVGEGSGVLVRVTEDRKAYVLTNHHVIEYPNNPGRITDRIGITFQSGRTIFVHPRDGAWSDPSIDLAVIMFDAADMDHLVVVDFADSDALKVGDWVVAIGSPFGLKQTVTSGIVSAKGRARGEVDMIQTDAAINPGNSGGPLLDLKGRLVGINTAIFTRSGGSEGIGFAIPSNTAKDVFEKLIVPPHRLIKGYLGVILIDLTPRDASLLKIPGGALIASVGEETPAEASGLRVRDVVTAIIVEGERKPVLNADELRRWIKTSKPGQSITLEIIRIERTTWKKITLDVVVGETPALQQSVNPRGRLIR